MKVMLTAAAREFNGYFKTYTAYIVLGVYLLLSFAAVFYSAQFFEYDNRGLISFFIYQPEILNILLPALTMKMWAEERRQGTLEILLTQPVRLPKLVLGKFLAAFAFSICLLLMFCPFVAYMSSLVEYDILNLIAAFIGEILVMAALCALGCMVSAFNGNVIIAYLSSVFVGWIWENVNFDFIISPLIKCFPLLTQRLSGVLNFGPYYQAVIQGQIGPDAVIYFVSVTVFALWLNVIAVNSRRA